jgi:peptidoglycan/LPS O-acetylase OafA/YrhL
MAGLQKRMRNPLRPTAAVMRRRWLWFAVPVAVVLVLAAVVSAFLDKPIRRTVEKQVTATPRDPTRSSSNPR